MSKLLVVTENEDSESIAFLDGKYLEVPESNFESFASSLLEATLGKNVTELKRIDVEYEVYEEMLDGRCEFITEIFNNWK